MSISAKFQNRFVEFVNEEISLTKHQLAEKMNITYVTFSNAYNYGIVPKPNILIRIADFFGTSVEYLLGNTDNEYFEKAKVPTTFQIRLKFLRESKHLTPSDLANATHIHRNNILQWAKFNYIPTLSDLTILKDYFNVSLDYLLGRTDDNTPYDDTESN